MWNRLNVKNDEVHWEEKLVYLDDDILYNPSGFLIDRSASYRITVVGFSSLGQAADTLSMAKDSPQLQDQGVLYQFLSGR
jgi:hypothetical protein